MVSHEASKKHKQNAESKRTCKITPKETFKKEDASLSIAKTLHELIGKETCFLCHEVRTEAHCKTMKHHEVVKSWIKFEIEKTKEPVKESLIYCYSCQLLLSGDISAESHYNTKLHTENVNNVCLVCNKKVHPNDMANHVKNSKNHKKKLKPKKSEPKIPESKKSEPKIPEPKKPVSKKPEPKKPESKKPELRKPESKKPESKKPESKKHEANKPKSKKPESKKPELGKPESKKPEANKPKPKKPEPKKPCNITKNDTVQKSKEVKSTSVGNTNVVFKSYKPLADFIFAFVGPSFCYICSMPGSLTHYNSGLHNKNLYKWLINDIRNVMALFNINYIEDVVCIACGVIFWDSSSAKSHYVDDEHRRTLNNFCKKCMVHEDPNKHKSHKNGANDKPFYIKEGSLTSGMILSANLRLLCKPGHCEICDKFITLSNIDHYKDNKHILMVKNWLHQENTKDYVDPKWIFCEICQRILCGTASAELHYNQLEHQYSVFKLSLK